MPPDVVPAVASLAAALVLMVGELVVSRANEKTLRRRGAIEPAGDVYRPLAWAYPMMFVAMAIEGVVAGPPAGAMRIAGVLVFALAKAFKFWAISTLGWRWTYRVLVPPDAPLVTSGPYARVRHPNYLAVFGEIAGFAMFSGVAFTGPLSLLTFGWLVRKRIAVEERALGRAGI